MTSVLYDFCDFIHEAQKERGSVSLYLRSHGQQFSEELESQFAVVDTRLKPLNTLPKQQNAKLEPFLHAAHYLAAKRKYIIARMIEAPEAISFYSREIIAPAIDITQELAVFDADNQPAKVAALMHFLQWKERVGLERALGTQLLTMDWKESPELRERLQYIISEQQAYERMFMMLADSKGREAIEKLKKENDSFKRVEEIHSALKNGTSPQLEALNATEWFNLFTAKMDVLHEVSRMMIKQLSKADEPSQKPAKTNGKASETSVPALSQSHADASGIESGVRAYMDTIKALPLFAGLDPASLNDILKYARITQHNKGALIFMQGEQASRFYIILEGWVKLFKGNVDGQESILQVLSTGDNLLETVIFNDTPLPVNAQAVDNVKLLSIPASMIREKLKNNHALAVNMLSTVSGRSQALISQFEQLTLKTVTQRVGWFLLKLFLESGDRTKNLKLPYDKSLIAGYLGMKPETFSRTLQTLKEQGIDIERSSIGLPDVFALCDFCDTDLAVQCSRHNTPECPNPQCVN